MQNTEETRAVLEWHLSMGIDETVAERPVDRFLPNHSSTYEEPSVDHIVRDPQAFTKTEGELITASTATSSLKKEEASLGVASELAMIATTFEELEAAVKQFNGC